MSWNEGKFLYSSPGGSALKQMQLQCCNNFIRTIIIPAFMALRNIWKKIEVYQDLLNLRFSEVMLNQYYCMDQKPGYLIMKWNENYRHSLIVAYVGYLIHTGLKLWVTKFYGIKPVRNWWRYKSEEGNGAGSVTPSGRTQIQWKEVLLNGTRREPDTEDVFEAPGGEPSKMRWTKLENHGMKWRQLLITAFGGNLLRTPYAPKWR